ncbi:type III polyketide synthase [Streptomyces sp. NPDC052687]|uniref:type III polyketide synthase n=1 Tax=Streptomyces sp. NPDC052687 TaxID=3154759 RepID=UPI003413F64D
MPTLCKPSVDVPEHIITLEETLKFAEDTHHGKPQLPLALRLIKNTGVQKRHLVQPIEKTLRHPGLEERNRIFEKEAKKRCPKVIEEALAHAQLTARDIDAIIFVSCTGFLMPSMTAWLINNMGFRSDTRQIPIAQLGCAAGGAAINRAHDFCTAYPHSNVLIVSCELCSLCYQPGDDQISSLLSDGLFGDAVAAAVVRGHGGTGISLERNASHLIPHTETWISYAVRSTGFHFQLDRRVPGTMKPLAPVLRDLTHTHGWNIATLDFYIIHAGGPRILTDLSTYLDVDPHKFRHSRTTLTQYGNIASAVVLDALRRLFNENTTTTGATGLIAGFGPGITAEMALGTWHTTTPTTNHTTTTTIITSPHTHTPTTPTPAHATTTQPTPAPAHAHATATQPTPAHATAHTSAPQPPPPPPPTPAPAPLTL